MAKALSVELAKHAALADVLADALERRGVAHRRAVLAARIGMAAFVPGHGRVAR